MATSARDWLRGLWAFYREYTDSAIHTATAAALAIFGLLVFVDPAFAALAITSYVVPPVVLYVLGGDESTGRVRERSTDEKGQRRRPPTEPSERSSPASQQRDHVRQDDSSNGDTDADGRDGDSDTDRDDSDTDSDSDGNDGDSDSDR